MSTDDAYRAALEREREDYARTGQDERASAVEAELARVRGRADLEEASAAPEVADPGAEDQERVADARRETRPRGQAGRQSRGR